LSRRTIPPEPECAPGPSSGEALGVLEESTHDLPSSSEVSPFEERLQVQNDCGKKRRMRR